MWRRIDIDIVPNFQIRKKRLDLDDGWGLLPLLVDGVSESQPERPLKCPKEASGKPLELEVVLVARFCAP